MNEARIRLEFFYVGTNSDSFRYLTIISLSLMGLISVTSLVSS